MFEQRRQVFSRYPWSLYAVKSIQIVLLNVERRKHLPVSQLVGVIAKSETHSYFARLNACIQSHRVHSTLNPTPAFHTKRPFPTTRKTGFLLVKGGNPRYILNQNRILVVGKFQN